VKITNGTYLRRALFATAATVAITAAGTAIAAAPPAYPGATAGATVNQSGPGGGQFGNSEANPSATSTINVSGAAKYIRDLDVRVNVPHDWSADIDLTLSHGGATVPLTTDNPDDGNGTTAWPNAFVNTVFDDQATTAVGADAPVGGIHIATISEAALGRFIGMDPNGAWTITATDDVILDSVPPVPPPDPLPDPTPFFFGSLDGWTLNIQTLTGPPPAPKATSHDLNTTATIADGGTVSQKITVAGADRYLTDANLTTAISHSFPGDLQVKLTAPSGKSTWISKNRGGASGGALVGAKFDDQATQAIASTNPDAGAAGPPAIPPIPVGATWSPEGAMAHFIGDNPNGEWTLTVRDTDPGTAGTLLNWKLDLQSTGGPPPPPPGPAVIPTSIPGDDACKPVPKRRSKSGGGKVPFKGSSLKIQQNQISVAILRLNAINARAKGGFLARDLCGYSFGAEDFASTVKWAGGGAAPAAKAKPRPLKFKKFKKKGTKFRLTKKQAAINDTLANFVLAKAKATQRRYKALGGGDLRKGTVTAGKLHKGLVVTGGKGGTAAGRKSKLPSFRWKKTQAKGIKKLDAAYLLQTQKKSQRAIRILNSITDNVNGGLKGSNFRNGQAPGSKLA